MANFRALTVQSGIHKQLQDADALIVGSGITTTSGNLNVTAAGGTINLNEAVSIGSGFSLASAGGSAAFDWSASTGAFKSSTGALTLTSGSASTLSTTAGALTITSAAAATWNTASGILTLNGTGGLTLQGGGVSVLAINATGTTVTLSGATLSTSGSGNINLPNNGTSRFQIEGSAVSANVTATNLATLTAGSSSVADSLHTHTSVNGSLTVTISGLTTTNMTSSGLFGYISANNTLSKTDNAAITTAKIFGCYEGVAGQMVLDGVIPDAQFTTAGGSPSAGAYVYLAAASDDSATGAGKLTATVPSSGIVAPVGILLDNTNYASAKTCKILLQIENPVSL